MIKHPVGCILSRLLFRLLNILKVLVDFPQVPIEQQPKLLALLGVWTSAGLFLHSMKAIHAAMVQPVPVPPAPAAQYLDSDRYRTQPPPQVTLCKPCNVMMRRVMLMMTCL